MSKCKNSKIFIPGQRKVFPIFTNFIVIQTCQTLIFLFEIKFLKAIIIKTNMMLDFL